MNLVEGPAQLLAENFNQAIDQAIDQMLIKSLMSVAEFTEYSAYCGKIIISTYLSCPLE